MPAPIGCGGSGRAARAPPPRVGAGPGPLRAAGRGGGLRERLVSGVHASSPPGLGLPVHSGHAAICPGMEEETQGTPGEGDLEGGFRDMQRRLLFSWHLLLWTAQG